MSERESISPSSPRLLALFQKRIEGDDALLELARLRFEEAGMGAESYAETPDELERSLGFRPKNNAPTTVHLSRSINLLQEEGRKEVVDFARRCRKRVYGLIVHDQREIVDRFDDYLAAVRDVAFSLGKIDESPYLFVEYAAGLEPWLFGRLFKFLTDCEPVSACIDTGHLGLWQAREIFSRSHPGKDICRIKPHDPELRLLVGDVQQAVSAALEQVLQVIREIGCLGKPLHFHLHDGHPLWDLSPFGVSDHLGFLTQIPIPFEHNGRKSLPPMFGPFGLYRILTEALRLVGSERLSFCLEIHPTEGKLPLGPASHFFPHWVDKENAEKMNFWLSVLAQNHMLVLDVCRTECAR